MILKGREECVAPCKGRNRRVNHVVHTDHREDTSQNGTQCYSKPAFPEGSSIECWIPGRK